MSTSRWTTLDQIVSIEAGGEAVALRNVPNTLSIFDSHFPRFHVLPGVLILGSLGALGSLLLQEETGRQWRLSGADKVGFRHFVQPGDQLRLTVKIKEHDDEGAVGSGDVEVEGKVVTRARRLRFAPVAGA
jgi:3-hydroxyacyl-[acyl-carrier-protein] dehydratase